MATTFEQAERDVIAFTTNDKGLLGSFKRALYELIFKADMRNREKLWEAYPNEVNAVQQYEGHKLFGEMETEEPGESYDSNIPYVHTPEYEEMLEQADRVYTGWEEKFCRTCGARLVKGSVNYMEGEHIDGCN